MYATISAAASVGASASQRCPPDTRTPNTGEAIFDVCYHLGCRLGRCFCFAEVSAGHPHSYIGEANVCADHNDLQPKIKTASRPEKGERRSFFQNRAIVSFLNV